MQQQQQQHIPGEPCKLAEDFYFDKNNNRLDKAPILCGDDDYYFYQKGEAGVKFRLVTPQAMKKMIDNYNESRSLKPPSSVTGERSTLARSKKSCIS